MKSKQAYLIFIVVLYLWLFYPPFWIFRDRLAISNVLTLVCIIVCIIKPRIFRDFRRMFHKEFSFCVGFFILSLFLTLFDFQTRILTEHLFAVLSLFVVIPVLLYFANEYNFGTESSIVKALLIVSCIGAFFSVWCIVDPDFNQYVKYSLIRYDKDSFLFETDYRGFGVASGLVSTYGYVMGFIGALGCFYLKENRWYLLALPFVFISILLNARTGLIIMIAGVFLSFLGRKNIMGSFLLAFGVLLFVTYIDSFLSLFNLSEGTMKWIGDFRGQAEDVAAAGSVMESSQTETLLKTMWVLPEDPIQWLVGRGYYLLRNEHGIKASDVGWINQLSYGGLLYLIPLVIFFLSIFRKVCKNKNLWYGLFFLSTIVIVNTKSSVFPSSVQLNVLMLMYFIFAMRDNGVGRNGTLALKR